MIKRNIALIVALFLIGASIFYLEDQKVDFGGDSAVIELGPGESIDEMTREEKAKIYDTAKELIPSGEFFNTENGEPITIAELIGKKIVMVDFWTYSCINCQRTLPYLTAWHDKYADQGLVILGVHSPEFEFEKDPENVAKAIERFGIEYPVIQDNDFGTWRSYKNRYWPRKYIIDIDGFIVYDHIGEGAYASTEMKIQELLKEKNERLGEQMEVSSGISQPEGVITRSQGRISPEVYFGAGRNEFLGNGRKHTIGVQNFDDPITIQNNELQLVGQWDIQHEHATNLEGGAKLRFRYKARDVFMVLSAPEPVRVKVLVNGKELGDERGADVDEEGYMTVQQERLYKIIQGGDNSKYFNFELIPETPDLEVFTFTFG